MIKKLCCFMLICILWLCVSFGTFASLIGDINSDGGVDAADLAALKKQIAGLESSIINTSDVDGDGYTNAADLALLKKHIAGLINLNPEPTPDIDYEDKDIWTDPV